MVKSLAGKLSLSPVSKLRTTSKKLFMCAGVLGFGVASVNAQEIKIGSTIHLQNRFSEGGRLNFLDTRGRVMDKPEFKGVSANGFVFTHASKNRDKGSGSWKIVSATGKKDGETLVFGDKVHLLNMYPGVGYLDEWGDKLVKIYRPILRNPNDTDYPVFTSKNRNRQNGSGTWTITVYQQKDKVGKPVNARDFIKLESGLHKNHYLRTYVRANELKAFKDYTGTDKLIFTSDTNFREGQEAWQISLAETDIVPSAKATTNLLPSKTLDQKPVHINWVNKTGSNVFIHWVDFEGNIGDGQLVKPGEAYRGTSYSGHVFRVFIAGAGNEKKELTIIVVNPSVASAPIVR